MRKRLKCTPGFVQPGSIFECSSSAKSPTSGSAIADSSQAALTGARTGVSETIATRQRYSVK